MLRGFPLHLRSLLRAASLALLALGLGALFLDLALPVGTDLVLAATLLAFMLSRAFREHLTEAHALPDNVADDPLAGSTGFWQPIAGHAASFKSQRLRRLASGSVAVYPTLASRLFHLIFVLVGLLALLVSGALALLLDGAERLVSLIPAVVGGTFVFVGTKALKPVRGAEFDRLRRECRCGDSAAGREPRGIPFDRIRGLQILKVAHRNSRIGPAATRGGQFTAYEVNLVVDAGVVDGGVVEGSGVEKGSRINLMSHGDLPSIILDAKMLARMLGVTIRHRL